MVAVNTNNWVELNQNPKALSEGRLQLHYASQLISSVGRYYTPVKSDDSHTNLGWVHPLKTLVSRMVHEGEAPFYVGLKVDTLELLILDNNLTVLKTLGLDGKTQTDGYQWLKEVLAKLGLDPSKLSETLPYEIPHHAIAKGATYNLDRIQEEIETHCAFFANANGVLKTLQDNNKSASEIRCWPHHFDIGLLIMMDSDKDPKNARSMGLGLSPGDENYPEPYFYTSPWPVPSLENLPAVRLGHWHTQGFVSVILTATELLHNEKTSAEQAKYTLEYFDEAMDICQSVLNG